ncbi:phytanoyl-CoA dioxygenase family protein [Planktomarina temperata]|nr:phytanoyl-CoA dioxygenase family protein [Planktomarina temperata]
MRKEEGIHPYLSQEDRINFCQNGFLHIKNFYPESLISDLKNKISLIIDKIAENADIDFQNVVLSDHFDAKLEFLLQKDRALVSTIYDAVKKIPECIQLASYKPHQDVTSYLLETDLPGFCPRGWGLRMDNPSEDEFSTQLHQDFSSQLTSSAGLVFWTPLREVNEDLGPMKVYKGSHKEGIMNLKISGHGSKGLIIADETVAERYEVVLAKCKPRDAIVLSFLTLHESSPNRSKFTRWSMLSRYFDFDNSVGREIGWRGGLQENNNFSELFPNLVIGDDNE